MISSCLAENNNVVPLVSIYSISNAACFGLLLITRIFIFYIEHRRKVPSIEDPSARTSYGIGAVVLLKYICGIGMSQTIASVLLFYLFVNQSDFNSQEYACQTQGSFIQILLPYFFIYTVATVLMFNYLRIWWTRYDFASKIGSYLIGTARDDNSSLDSTRSRLSDINSQYTDNEDVDKVDKIAELAFRSVSTAVNMHVSVDKLMFNSPQKRSSTTLTDDYTEEVVVAFLPSSRGAWIPPIIRQIKRLNPDKRIRVICIDAYETKYNVDSQQWLLANMAIERCQGNIQVVWTNYTNIDLPAESVDFVIMPTGNVLPYLSQGEDKDTIRTLTIHFLAQVHRILRRGGKFISSNLLHTHNTWFAILSESSFGGDRLEILPEKVYWSIMPAKITIATKLASLSSDSLVSLPTELRLQTSLFRYPIFPQGWHWRFMEIYLVFIVIIWTFLVWLSWYYLQGMQYPLNVPYSVMFSGLCITIVTTLPIVFYVIFGRLRKEASEISTEVLLMHTDSSIDIATLPLIHPISEMSINRVSRAFLANIFDVVVVTFSLVFLGWLPYLVIDFILVNATDMSTTRISYFNTFVSIGVTIYVVVVAPYLSRWYLHFKKVQEHKEAKRHHDEIDEIEHKERLSTTEAHNPIIQI